MGGYEQGMEAAVGLLDRLYAWMFRSEYRNDTRNNEISAAVGAIPVRPLELMVVGRAPEALQKHWNAHLAQCCNSDQVAIRWIGPVNRDDVPALDRAAHLLYASDINAACPNSVIEALACGLPVLSFDTGALPEMVPPSAGQIAPYGGDPWKLEPPDLDGLAGGAVFILNSQAELRPGARQHAEQVFGLDRMVEAYLNVLFES